MPTYAYACSDCGHRFEVRQSFSDSALTECPQCHGGVRKLFNTVGIVFKGSGFYRTDSRTNGSGSKGETSGGSTESSTSESAKPAEKKPADAKPSSAKAADKKPAASTASGGSAA